jgi:hypothetical protein
MKDDPIEKRNREALDRVIETIDDLDERHKIFLRSRWMGELLLWEKHARQAAFRYHLLRVMVILSGVIITGLAGLAGVDTRLIGLNWIIVVLGIIVAGGTGVEDLFQFGQVWRKKRKYSELLKLEGWRFLQLSDQYKGKKHDEAYTEFASRVEKLIEIELEDYLGVFQEAEQKRTAEKEPTS